MDDQQPKTDDTSNLSSQYQSILDKYATDLAIKTTPPPPPVSETLTEVPPPLPRPPEPVIPPRYELPPSPPETSVKDGPIYSTPSRSNGFFKVLFFLSLTLFIAVLSANIYTFFIVKPTNVAETTPTLIPIPTKIAVEVCELNEIKYQIGQTFAAQDGCNTCTCQSDKTISCTAEICPTAGPTKKLAPLTVSSVYPTSGNFGTKITISGTGFNKTTNTVVLASTCSFFYKDLPSDGQKIVLTLTTPSEIKCASTEISPVPTKPIQLIAGSYDLSVNVGEKSSYTKAKLIKFKFMSDTVASPSATPAK